MNTTPNISTALVANELSFFYHKTEVFSDVSLELTPGQMAVLVGRNGSGKTTLMRCLAGWAPCTTGTLTLCGEPFDGSNQKQRGKLFFVNDAPSFYDDLTAEEHLNFILALNQKKNLMPLAFEHLNTFELYAKRKQFPSSYSRGMRLKLALVIALTLRPPLILLDEPFGPLDTEASALLCRELKRATEQGSAVLLSIHHYVEGLNPHKAWRLENGTLRSEGLDIAGTLMQQAMIYPDPL